MMAFSTVDLHVDRIRSELIVKGTWTGRDFLEASARLKHYDQSIAFDRHNPAVIRFLENLRDFLVSKREFLFGLLENPNLLEYESFF